MAKFYRVKEGEDLGFIAKKFWLPSWKYLYEINRDRIGDNPDILKVGIKIEVPQIENSTGMEKLQAKLDELGGGKASDYVGGASYQYPWVAQSISLVDEEKNIYKEKNKDGEEQDEFSEELELVIKKEETEIIRKKIKHAGELSMLLPNSDDLTIDIDSKLEVDNAE